MAPEVRLDSGGNEHLLLSPRKQFISPESPEQANGMALRRSLIATPTIAIQLNQATVSAGSPIATSSSLSIRA
jgi:hypothetical protein